MPRFNLPTVGGAPLPRLPLLIVVAGVFAVVAVLAVVAVFAVVAVVAKCGGRGTHPVLSLPKGAPTRANGCLLFILRKASRQRTCFLTIGRPDAPILHLPLLDHSTLFILPVLHIVVPSREAKHRNQE